MSYLVDLGPESLLSPPEGELAGDLQARLDLALRYIANWYKATKASDDKEIWWAKIDDVRARVELAERLMSPAQVFPGNAELAAYNDAAPRFAQLWRDLTLSADTLPDASLLTVAADVVDTILSTPRYIVTRIAEEVGKAAGDGAKKLIWDAWPFLLAAGVVGGAYLFRRPLIRLAGSIK